MQQREADRPPPWAAAAGDMAALHAAPWPECRAARLACATWGPSCHPPTAQTCTSTLHTPLVPGFRLQSMCCADRAAPPTRCAGLQRRAPPGLAGAAMAAAGCQQRRPAPAALRDTAGPAPDSRQHVSRLGGARGRQGGALPDGRALQQQRRPVLGYKLFAVKVKQSSGRSAGTVNDAV